MLVTSTDWMWRLGTGRSARLLGTASKLDAEGSQRLFAAVTQNNGHPLQQLLLLK